MAISYIGNKVIENALKGGIDLSSTTIKCILLKQDASIDSSMQTYSDIQGQELADGNGYTAGGIDLQNVSIDTSSQPFKLDADDITIDNATFTTLGYALYADNANKDILVAETFDNAVEVTSGTFKVVWDNNGIINVAEGN